MWQKLVVWNILTSNMLTYSSMEIAQLPSWYFRPFYWFVIYLFQEEISAAISHLYTSTSTTLRFVKNYISPSVLVTAFLLLPVNTQTTLYSLKHEIGLHCSLFRLIISKKKVTPFRIHQMKVFYLLSLVKSCSFAYTIFIILIYFNHISTFSPWWVLI